MATGNLGKWDAWYAGLPASAEPRPYADTQTYRLGADWLKDCARVEDWGCGLGWARRFFTSEQYRGIDGTLSPFADVVADLEVYRSRVPGIFMRHVLEHNPRWPSVLTGALASFTVRMALVLFTPMTEETREIGPFDNGIDVPNIAFAPRDLEVLFEAAGLEQWRSEDLATGSFYGTERVYYLEKS